MDYERIAAEIIIQDHNRLVMCGSCQAKTGQTMWQLVQDGCRGLDQNALKTLGIRGLEQMVAREDAVACGHFIAETEALLAEGKSQQCLQPCVVYLRLARGEQAGVYRWYRLERIGRRDPDAQIVQCVILISETTAEDRYRLELARTITNDRTPAYFIQGAQELIREHPDAKYALIQFDVAKFKLINEQYGEGTGDEILSHFITMLDMICSPSQLFVRLTADVFMILTTYRQESELLDFVAVLQEKLSGYRNIPYTLYFGISLVEDVMQPLRKYGDGAAFARQSIKGDALQHVAFYREEMKASAKMKKFLEDNMEHALHTGEFVMYLQPKFCISQDRIIGAEGLVRWNSPKYGVIAPNEFIPLFEQNGFVITLDEYIWEEACKTLARWREQGYTLIPISVNMSRKHLLDTRFVDVLENLVAKYHIDKQYLEIELTETLEEAPVIDAVSLLKEHDFHLLMDDFGSGYSSLNTLKDTKFDVVKIDRFFLKDFIDSSRGRKIVEHTIRMTADIGLDLIAEGVETKEQAQFLEDCGCDKAQGYYYDKPIPIAQFEDKYMKA